MVASGSACAMADEVASLPGAVRFFPYTEAIVKAEAWNRGIRESFAELLLLIEPGDRLPLGALTALAGASEMDSAAAWVSGKVSGDDSESPEPLRGALIRKSAFRKFGLFPADPFFQGREQQTWLQRMQENGLTGRAIDTVTLRAASKPGRHLLRPDLNFLRAELVRRQGKKSE